MFKMSITTLHRLIVILLMKYCPKLIGVIGFVNANFVYSTGVIAIKRP